MDKVKESNKLNTVPDIKGEMDEIKRVSQQVTRNDNFPISVEQIINSFKGIKAQTLTPEIWNKLENTESNQVQKGEFEKVLQIATMYGKSNPYKLKLKLIDDTYKRPLIVKFDGDRYHLVSGNTRLSTAASMGIYPMVFIGDLDVEVNNSHSNGEVVSVQDIYEQIPNTDRRITMDKLLNGDWYYLVSDTYEYKNDPSKEWIMTTIAQMIKHELYDDKFWSILHPTTLQRDYKDEFYQKVLPNLLNNIDATLYRYFEVTDNKSGQVIALRDSIDRLKHKWVIDSNLDIEIKSQYASYIERNEGYKISLLNDNIKKAIEHLAVNKKFSIDTLKYVGVDFDSLPEYDQDTIFKYVIDATGGWEKNYGKFKKDIDKGVEIYCGNYEINVKVKVYPPKEYDIIDLQIGVGEGSLVTIFDGTTHSLTDILHQPEDWEFETNHTDVAMEVNYEVRDCIRDYFINKYTKKMGLDFDFDYDF